MFLYIEEIANQSLLPNDNNFLLIEDPSGPKDFFPIPPQSDPTQNNVDPSPQLNFFPSENINKYKKNKIFISLQYLFIHLFFFSGKKSKQICLSGFRKNEDVEIDFPLNKKIGKLSENFVTLETFSLSVPTAPLNLPLLWSLLPNISIFHTKSLNKELEINVEGNIPENIQNLINNAEENKKFQNLKVLVLKYFFKGRHFHVRIYAKGEIQIFQVNDPNQFIDSSSTHPIQVKGYDMYRIPIECQEHALFLEQLYEEAWIQYELLRNVIYMMKNVGHSFLSVNAIPILYLGLRYTLFSSMDANNNKNKKMDIKEKNKDLIDRVKKNEFYDFQIHTDGNYIHIDIQWNFRFTNRSRRKTIKINSLLNNNNSSQPNDNNNTNPSQTDQRRRKKQSNNSNNTEEERVMEEFTNAKKGNEKYDEMDIARKIKYTNDIFEQNLKPLLEESKNLLLLIQQESLQQEMKNLSERMINGKKEKFIVLSFSAEKKAQIDSSYQFPTKSTIQHDLDESIGNNTYPLSSNYFIFPYSKVFTQKTENSTNRSQQQINPNTSPVDLMNGEFIFGNVIVVEIKNRIQRICQITKEFILSNSSNSMNPSNIPSILNLNPNQ